MKLMRNAFLQQFFFVRLQYLKALLKVKIADLVFADKTSYISVDQRLHVKEVNFSRTP